MFEFACHVNNVAKPQIRYQTPQRGLVGSSAYDYQLHKAWGPPLDIGQSADEELIPLPLVQDTNTNDAPWSLATYPLRRRDIFGNSYTIWNYTKVVSGCNIRLKMGHNTRPNQEHPSRILKRPAKLLPFSFGIEHPRRVYPVKCHAARYPKIPC